MDPSGRKNYSDTEELDELDDEQYTLALSKGLVRCDEDSSEDTEGTCSENDEDGSDVHFQVVLVLTPGLCALILFGRIRRIASRVEVRGKSGR